MTDCAYYMELISAELDGELTEAERARLTAHLEQCPACRRYRQALASVSGALADSLEPPPATLARSVMARVKTLPVPGSAPEPEAAPAAREGRNRRLARGRCAWPLWQRPWPWWSGRGTRPCPVRAAPPPRGRTTPDDGVLGGGAGDAMEAPAAYMSAAEGGESAPAADEEASVTGASAEAAASEETAGEAQSPAEEPTEPELGQPQWESAQLLGLRRQPVPGCRGEGAGLPHRKRIDGDVPRGRPGREGDWTLTLRAAGGEEETYILWQEGERLYWAPAAGGEAWLAGASPEELARGVPAVTIHGREACIRREHTGHLLHHHRRAPPGIYRGGQDGLRGGRLLPDRGSAV